MQLLAESHGTSFGGEINAVTQTEGRIVVSTSSGDTMALPTVWLRDNCVCEQCRITATGEHRYFLGQAETLPSPTAVALATERLIVTWSDDHTSEFSADDLRKLLHVADRSNGVARIWSDDFAPERFSRRDILGDIDARLEFFRTAMKDGMVVVTDMPNESGECIRFLEELKLPIRDTPFDRLHDVFFRADGYNVAHTDEALPPHNDFASYTWPPSGQLIHMLVNDVAGGEWVNVDGFRVLAQLWKSNPDAVRTLTKVPVAFREHADYAESWTRAPLVRIDGRGNITGLRFSNQLMQPMSPLDPDVDAFYEAYHLLARAVNDPANQMTPTLNSMTSHR